MSKKAAEALRRLAKNKRELVSLMEEAGDLLEENLIPLDEAKKVFKSGIDSNANSTPVSEKLFGEAPVESNGCSIWHALGMAKTVTRVP